MGKELPDYTTVTLAGLLAKKINKLRKKMVKLEYEVELLEAVKKKLVNLEIGHVNATKSKKT